MKVRDPMKLHTRIHTYIHNTRTYKLIHFQYTCIHSYIYTYIHSSNIHTYIHSYIHTYIHSYIHTYVLTCDVFTEGLRVLSFLRTKLSKLWIVCPPCDPAGGGSSYFVVVVQYDLLLNRSGGPCGCICRLVTPLW